MSTTLLTVPEVADRLRISNRSVYRLLKENRVDFYRINGQLRIPAEALEVYLTAAVVPAVPR